MFGYIVCDIIFVWNKNQIEKVEKEQQNYRVGSNTVQTALLSFEFTSLLIIRSGSLLALMKDPDRDTDRMKAPRVLMPRRRHWSYTTWSYLP